MKRFYSTMPLSWCTMIKRPNRILTIHSAKRSHRIAPKLAKLHTVFYFAFFLVSFFDEQKEEKIAVALNQERAPFFPFLTPMNGSCLCLPYSISLPKLFDILLQFINHGLLYCLEKYIMTYM